MEWDVHVEWVQTCGVGPVLWSGTKIYYIDIWAVMVEPILNAGRGFDIAAVAPLALLLS